MDKHKTTAAQRKAIKKYRANKERIAFDVPKGTRDIIKAQADKHGLSVNAYLTELVWADINNDK